YSSATSFLNPKWSKPTFDLHVPRTTLIFRDRQQHANPRELFHEWSSDDSGASPSPTLALRHSG
ncbi:hypothetical protein CDAR_192711, partial [Caerostris darwini]